MSLDEIDYFRDPSLLADANPYFDRLRALGPVVRMPGYDEMYVGYVPSYAAAAWYHNKLANKPADLRAYLDQVRTFAQGPYAAALAKGQDVPPAEADAVARQLAAYTGLSVQYIKEANLRVEPSRFRKELLRNERRTLGRYDARFEGVDEDAAGEVPGYDASDTGISGAFVSAFHDYVTDQLMIGGAFDSPPAESTGPETASLRDLVAG